MFKSTLPTVKRPFSVGVNEWRMIWLESLSPATQRFCPTFPVGAALQVIRLPLCPQRDSGLPLPVRGQGELHRQATTLTDPVTRTLYNELLHPEWSLGKKNVYLPPP